MLQRRGNWLFGLRQSLQPGIYSRVRLWRLRQFLSVCAGPVAGWHRQKLLVLPNRIHGSVRDLCAADVNECLQLRYGRASPVGAVIIVLSGEET
jgi:hypothetical protein